MLKYYFQFFTLIIVINSYGQNDSVTISKKLNKARYWLTTKSFNDLKKLSNLVTKNQIHLDSFKVIYNKAFDDLSERLDSLDERERKQKTILTISNLFESTVNYKGRVIDENQPGNVLSLLVEIPIGVNLYAAQNYWAYEKNPMALTELGIGFEKEFLDYFTASLIMSDGYLLMVQKKREMRYQILPLPHLISNQIIYTQTRCILMFGAQPKLVLSI